MTIPHKVFAGVFWLVAFGLPVIFLFADVGAKLPDGELVRIYTAAIQVMGESGARVFFCMAWLALDIALFWRLKISKRAIEPEPEGWPNG